MSIEIVYRGHKGEHREYFICSYCGTAFYDNTFIPHMEIRCSPSCPVCGVLAMHVEEEEFKLYVKAHNDLTESISTEGCADRMPDGTEK